MELDPNREFWVGMRNTYLQQMRLLRERFGAPARGRPGGGVGGGAAGGAGEDAQLVESVVASLGCAVAAIERRWGLRGRGQGASAE